MFKKLPSLSAVAKTIAGSSAIELRFGTLENARDELNRLVHLQGGCHPTSPRARLLERQCKAARHLIAQHELRANKSAANKAADRDAEVATAALGNAMEAIASATDRSRQQCNENSRLSARVDATRAEFDRLRQSAEAAKAARQSDFDAAMRSGDDAAQTAAAEALSKARRLAAEFADGASHPILLRLAALQAQLVAASDAADGLAQQIDAAELERKEAEVTLAQVASDRASDVALEAFAVALALSAGANRTRPSTMEGVYFWSPERSHAKQYIGVLGRGGFVTGHGIQQLGEIARQADVRAFDEDPMQLRGTQFTEEQSAVIAAEERQRSLERKQREWDGHVPTNPHDRVAFARANPRPHAA